MTDRRPADLELAFGVVSATFDRIVRERCPGQSSLARTLFERIGPDRWTLEWSLPVWLGEALGLDPPVIAEIVLSDVMGLGSIRLEDDLIDGEVPPEEVGAARLLSAVLFEAALEPYRAMFDGRSPFWAELDRRMTEWRSAAEDDAPTVPAEDGAPTVPAQGDREPHAGRLAARAAPLHVPAYAVCLATGRPDVYPLLGRALDHALEALVLYDAAADWEADLTSGRRNAFVAALAGETDAAASADGRRTAVRVALMTSDRARAYFDAIGDRLSRAIALTEQLPVPIPRLINHLRSVAAEVDARGGSYADHYRRLGDRTARLMVAGPAHGR